MEARESGGRSNPVPRVERAVTYPGITQSEHVRDQSVVPAEERAAHLAAVGLRHASHAGGGADRLQARMDALGAKVPSGARDRLIHRALVAKTVAQRVMWLRREADLVTAASRGVAACSRRCSHCCHVAVMVAEPEADEIGRALGRRPADPPAGAFVRLRPGMDTDGAARDLQDRQFGVPCTFLRDGECSIYDFRPLVCRYLINVDDDALLCRLVPGQQIDVPYADSRMQRLAYVAAMGKHGRWADLRDWFPRDV